MPIRTRAHTLTRCLSPAAIALACTQAWSHDGHGAGSFHWHASDILGLVLVGALGVAALWLARK